MQGNLPNWTGAAGAYRRAYRILAGMAAAGHVKRSWGKCYVSQEMRDFIKDLNEGNEESVKYNNLLWLRYDDIAYCPAVSDQMRVQSRNLGQDPQITPDRQA